MKRYITLGSMNSGRTNYHSEVKCLTVLKLGQEQFDELDPALESTLTHLLQAIGIQPIRTQQCGKARCVSGDLRKRGPRSQDDTTANRRAGRIELPFEVRISAAHQLSSNDWRRSLLTY